MKAPRSRSRSVCSSRPRSSVLVRPAQVADAMTDALELILTPVPRPAFEQRVTELVPVTGQDLRDLAVVQVGERVLAVRCDHVRESGVLRLPLHSRLDHLRPREAVEGPQLDVGQFTQPGLELPPPRVG